MTPAEVRRHRRRAPALGDVAAAMNLNGVAIRVAVSGVYDNVLGFTMLPVEPRRPLYPAAYAAYAFADAVWGDEVVFGNAERAYAHAALRWRGLDPVVRMRYLTGQRG